jgi:hypothetical protein
MDGEFGTCQMVLQVGGYWSGHCHAFKMNKKTAHWHGQVANGVPKRILSGVLA